jgi:hypothetical protein
MRHDNASWTHSSPFRLVDRTELMNLQNLWRSRRQILASFITGTKNGMDGGGRSSTVLLLKAIFESAER